MAGAKRHLEQRMIGMEVPGFDALLASSRSATQILQKILILINGWNGGRTLAKFIGKNVSTVESIA